MQNPDPKQRLCLLLDPGKCVSSQLDCAALSGWRFETAREPLAAWKFLKQTHPRVGLIAFQRDSPLRHTIEPLIDHPGTEWIALLPPDWSQGADRLDPILLSFFDHHTLPIDAHRLAFTLGHAFGRAALHSPPENDLPGRFGMTGSSEPMLALYRDIERIAAADVAVLIEGESGTGKDLIARAIARHSRRANGPFVAINCGALPSGLIQSELFGFEKGAFTGATRRSIGHIEAAHRGVLLLDEVGDLPLDQQANLLRFLQEKTITRLGSNHSIPVDVRIIAATHVGLAQAVAENRFREDLFYRLSVLTLNVPPLRARGRDITLLARHLLADTLGGHRATTRVFSSEALLAIQQHHWPGNVRELINRIRRAAVMSAHKRITPRDLGLPTPAGSCVASSLDHARENAEKTTIEEALATSQHNVSRAAHMLGVSRVTLYRMMRRHRITCSRIKRLKPARADAC